MKAVLDASVVVPAMFWEGEAYLLLVKLAHRKFFVYGTAETIEESREACLEQLTERPTATKAIPRLNWYCDKVKLVAPAPLGKPRSRDPKDDPYLAAALAAQAGYVVAYDRDLLDLGKPFGIQVLRPMAFLKLLSQTEMRTRGH